MRKEPEMKRGIIGIMIAAILVFSMSFTAFAETSISVEDMMGFLQGEAGADGEITLYEIFQLYAEKDHETGETPDLPQAKESEAEGFLSEEELLKAYIDCLNGDLSFDEFYKGFDEIGHMAYWIQEERGQITVPEAYDVLLYADQGVDYIKEAFPDFARKWEEHTGSELTDESWEYFLMNYSIDREIGYEQFSSFMQRLSEQFGPFDTTIRPEEIWHSDYGYSDYGVSVEDPEDYIQSIGIIYMEKDGRYYWIMLHQTA